MCCGSGLGESEVNVSAYRMPSLYHYTYFRIRGAPDNHSFHLQGRQFDPLLQHKFVTSLTCQCVHFSEGFRYLGV